MPVAPRLHLPPSLAPTLLCPLALLAGCAPLVSTTGARALAQAPAITLPPVPSAEQPGDPGAPNGLAPPVITADPLPAPAQPLSPMLPSFAMQPLPDAGPRSTALPSGLFSPMPGGLLSGYSADTGLDIAGFKRPVFAIANGTLDYAEAGHTRWTGKGDSRLTIRLALDEPIAWKGHAITHVYYGHLSSLVAAQPHDAPSRFHVDAGQQLGVSGWANGSPHLHIGLLLDGHVEQDDWAFILDEAEVRKALGVGANGKKLPG